ncbi:MAG TPA: choice-of-anchor D domain-containing protein, partial [Flavobacterium sp.]|nr:choice-of-anchor D domain-containing protein [Flavobacterium sp.]
MPTSVGTNPSTAYAGNGFSPNPTIAGRLNSNAWDVQGFSFGTLGFGGTQTLDSFGRGSVTSGVITTGIYAFTELPATVANPTLMIQPGAGEFAPGSITLRIRNNGTSNMTQLQVSYNLFFRNDGDMSNSFNFSHSDDNIIYVEEPTMDFISPELLDPFEWVQESVSPSRSFVISGINVAPGGFYYIRWSCDDVSGTGIRDEFGLDDIQITGTYGAPAPEINVTGIGLTIPNGNTVPRVADGTEFAPIGSPLSTLNNTILKTFNIQNIGGLPLTISSVVIGGPNPEDFTIFIPTAGSPPTGTISEIISGAISSNELNIVFDPSVAGLRSATVYIYSDDADENPYVFGIRGYGFNPTPEITLTGNTGGTGPIASGSLTPLVGNNTLYTTQIVGVTNQTKDFKIKNDGTTVLTLTGVSPYITIGGTNPSDFSLVTFPSTPNMNPGFFKTFSNN